MVDPIPPKLKKIWDDWNIRGVMLFSLSMQTILIFFAPFRKGTANKLIILLLWSAYLLADWAANFAVGLISQSEGGAPDSSTPSSENSDLLAFWPPFLLLHLGGPDTITAFALEDNELWIRHLLGLIFQAVAAVYVFLQSLPKTRLAIPTILMFFAGTIKYLERTLALYLASLDRFRDSMLKEPDPGPNFAKLMDEYSSMIDAGLPAKIITIQRPEREYKAGDDKDPEGKRKFSDLEVIHKAHYYLKFFKGLLFDLIFSFYDRDESRNFFTMLSSEDALRVIEVELNLIYEVFYTKIRVVHSIIGYIMRFTSFGLVVAAFSLFCFRVKKHNYDEFDVRITYILFWGAIGLDTVAFFMLVFFDWTFVALQISGNESKSLKMIKSRIASLLSWFLIFKKPRWYECQKHSVGPKHEVLATPFLFRRWSGSVSGHNLVRYCLKARLTRIHHKVSHIRDKIVYYLGFVSMGGLPDFVDEIIYVSHEPLTKELWELIFKELKRKSEILSQSNDPEAAKKICSARGDGILHYIDKDFHDRLLPYLTDVAYDESLLLWHIATELLYHTDGEEEGVTSNYREFSKLLSDYMLYLLVMQPSMMSAVASTGKIRFRDTCAEANRFFKMRDLKGNQEGEACQKIFELNTYMNPETVKGDRSESVLFDGSMLAKVMSKVDGKWEVLSKIWVEMVSYAAYKCSARSHAHQVSKGGELITFVWLLMVHFGIGDQFQLKKGTGRTKLIVTK